MSKKEIFNKYLDKYYILLCGVLVGVIVFGAIYGFEPLNVLNDRWILHGYDEVDIIQHYAGWCAFKNAGWSFPLGLMKNMGGGTIVTFTDSIPLIAFVAKFVLDIIGYKGTFQYFGIYTLICYVLQSISIGLLIKRKTEDKSIILLSMVLCSFSPILMERAIRHTALGSHFLILFAIYYTLKGRDLGYSRYPVAYYILSLLAISIHPYFIPLVLIFAFIFTIESIIEKHKYINIIHFGANIVLCALFGYIIGALGWVSTARWGYGLYSMNVNALINPISIGDYKWSSLLKPLPQIKGNYDGFNYLGLGNIILILICVFLVCKTRKNIKSNWVFILCMMAMTLFAITNEVTLNDKEILVFSLPDKLLYFCNIFRASSRMFYAVYYSMIIFSLYRLIEYIGEDEKKRIIYLGIIAIVVIQIMDLKTVISEKHGRMKENMARSSIVDYEELNNRLGNYDVMMDDGWGFDTAVVAAKNNLEIVHSVANTGDFENSMTRINEGFKGLQSGNKDYSTVYVTRSEDIVNTVLDINDDIELLQYRDEYYMFPIK